MTDFAIALAFLTTLPAPAAPYDPARFARAGRWYPLVGLLIGGLLLAVHWLAGLLFPPLLTAALVVTVWVAITGGLHLDGLADCCDGLLAPVDRDRRLAIMRDPRAGAFAVVGVALLLILKVAAVAALATPVSALLLAPVWARWTLLLAARQPSAREGGMGASFAKGLTPGALGMAFALALAPSLALLLLGDWRAPIAILAAHGAALAAILLARARLGGVTGDVFGLVVEVSELAVLLVYVAGG
jgi:adenosylcobinamide-GDP ribazoletransferase